MKKEDMYTLKEEIIDEIIPDNLGLYPQLWLEEEVNYLALKHSGLDEIPLSAIYPLAYLYAHGPADEKQISSSLKIEGAEIEKYLEALCDFEFAEIRDSDYKYRLTEKGINSCKSIGNNIVIRKRFEIKGRLEHLNYLYKNLNQF